MRRSERALTIILLSYTAFWTVTVHLSILFKGQTIETEPGNWTEAENDLIDQILNDLQLDHPKITTKPTPANSSESLKRHSGSEQFNGANSVFVTHLDQEEDVSRRAPYFLIIGAQKCGTRAMSNFLIHHPQIKYHNEPEMHFFTAKFPPFINETASRLAQKEIFEVEKARQAHAHYYKYEKLERNKSLVGFDSTPLYLFQSNTVAPRVKLVNPWAKLIILLRNPVDRAYSDYNMELTQERTNVTFEEYVETDLKRLQRAGLVDAWNGTNWDKKAFDSFRGSNEEDKAWNEYLSKRKQGFCPIGRGLYAIQLRQWLYHYNISYTDEQSQFLVLRQEDARGVNGTIRSFNQIVKFLGLAQHELTFLNETHVGNYTQGSMSLQTRTLLEEFFEPYNQQLLGLLGQQWANVWNDSKKQKN